MGDLKFRVIEAGCEEPIAYFKCARDAQCFMVAAYRLGGWRECQLLRLERLYGQMAGQWLNPDDVLDDLADQEVA
jgi:hypothetical protein